MIGGLRIKICGLTTASDAAAAAAVGADFLGFILHPASPRRVTPAQFAALRPQLPDRPTVAVLVEPTAADFAAAAAAGFDRFQLHCRRARIEETVTTAAAVARDRIWLAPRLAPADELAADEVRRSDTWLLDTYRADRFGGTGQTGDWAKFRRLRERHPERTWILAGGLGPDNVAAALRASGARFIDVNSGVERAPGAKDAAKLEALGAAVAAAGIGD